MAASAADPNAGVDGLISDCSNRHGMPIALELRDALRHFRLSEPEPASSVEVASGVVVGVSLVSVDARAYLGPRPGGR